MLINTYILDIARFSCSQKKFQMAADNFTFTLTFHIHSRVSKYIYITLKNVKESIYL